MEGWTQTKATIIIQFQFLPGTAGTAGTTGGSWEITEDMQTADKTETIDAPCIFILKQFI